MLLMLLTPTLLLFLPSFPMLLENSLCCRRIVVFRQSAAALCTAIRACIHFAGAFFPFHEWMVQITFFALSLSRFADQE